MARPLRPLVEGGWYHVTNRGVDRMNIFRDDTDRRRFLALLEEATGRHEIEVHAYCLMGNHYHLLLRSRKPNLDQAIHRAMSLYAREFNRRHRRDGPLFKSRYHSCLVTDDSYLLAVTRYIHRNPVDLGCDDIANYKWSSLPMYLGRRRRVYWVNFDFTIKMVGGRAAYSNFVLGPFETVVERQLASTKRPTQLGPELPADRGFVAPIHRVA